MSNMVEGERHQKIDSRSGNKVRTDVMQIQGFADQRETESELSTSCGEE